MKRNNLTTAVVAAIAGVAGIASVSNAVNLNSDGLGQVLVYPYYTVNNGLNTLISVVNTTDEVKAVKVRFLEGKNSRECLDFNLYLSPYDVWTAALTSFTSTAAGTSAGYSGQESVRIITADTSCTAPAINNHEFLPWGFDPQGTGAVADDYDNGGQDLARCTEGHFEMIEMGVVTDVAANSNAATASTHGVPGSANAGVPNNCGTIVGNWAPGGDWIALASAGITPPTGGLFGSASVIDVANGVDVSYNADAIQAYSDAQQHSDTGNLLPNLASGSGVAGQTSNIFNNGAVVTDLWATDSIQAVSALYMHNNIYSEYELSDGFNANTEMVITFPTKNQYVDSTVPTLAGLSPVPVEPFTSRFIEDAEGTACEEYAISTWDREEQDPTDDVADVIPSPLPPGIVTTRPQFCFETNVLELHNGSFDVTADSAILGSKPGLVTHWSTTATSAPTYFANGWIALNLELVGAGNHETNDNATPRSYEGLPVTGFSVQRYVNAAGASKNYAGLFSHRYSKLIN